MIRPFDELCFFPEIQQFIVREIFHLLFERVLVVFRKILSHV